MGGACQSLFYIATCSPPSTKYVATFSPRIVVRSAFPYGYTSAQRGSSVWRDRFHGHHEAFINDLWIKQSTVHRHSTKCVHEKSTSWLASLRPTPPGAGRWVPSAEPFAQREPASCLAT